MVSAAPLLTDTAFHYFFPHFLLSPTFRFCLCQFDIRIYIFEDTSSSWIVLNGLVWEIAPGLLFEVTKVFLLWMNNRFPLTAVTWTRIADVFLMRICPSFSSSSKWKQEQSSLSFISMTFQKTVTLRNQFLRYSSAFHYAEQAVL